MAHTLLSQIYITKGEINGVTIGYTINTLIKITNIQAHL